MFCFAPLPAVVGREYVMDIGPDNKMGMQFARLDIEFGKEPKVVSQPSDPVVPFEDSVYLVSAVDTKTHTMHAMFASAEENPRLGFATVSVDTGKVRSLSPDLHKDLAHIDPFSAVLAFDHQWNLIVLASTRPNLPILDVYTIDPATWNITHCGSFGKLGLDFFLVEDAWAYGQGDGNSSSGDGGGSGGGHRMVLAAGLPNTTVREYAGVMITASLERPSPDTAVTAKFSADTFESTLSIMEDLGCMAPDGGSVLGFNVTIQPLGSTLARWSLSSLQTVEPVGAWHTMASDSVWAGKAACVPADHVYVVPMDYNMYHNSSYFWMHDTRTGERFVSKTVLPFFPSSVMAALE